MKYKIHKSIEAKNLKRKAALDNRIKKELNISDDDDNSVRTETSFKKPFYTTYRFFAGISTALVVMCLAIVLPIVLVKGEKLPSIHYRNADDCVEIRIDYSLKVYGERNDVSYLYIDWYDLAEDIQTKLYVSEDNPDELIYIQEMIANGETGSVVILYITDLYTKIDILDTYSDVCTSESIVCEVKVFWCYNNRKNLAYFEYGNYRYYIELSYPLEEDSILELIEEMIQ